MRKLTKEIVEEYKCDDVPDTLWRVKYGDNAFKARGEAINEKEFKKNFKDHLQRLS